MYLPVIIGCTLANFSVHFFTKEKNYAKAWEATVYQATAVFAVWFVNSEYGVAWISWATGLFTQWCV